ncbi:lytic transglycosylase domain-containing protein [Verrucomicrobiota bacterium sgz303538]
MKQTVWTLILVLAVAAVAAATLRVGFSHDPEYTVREWFNGSRFWNYDHEIDAVARRHGVDPMLVKAVVWRESGFHPDKVGTSGERGLMQVSEVAARDWVKAEKIETFAPTDLFDPKTNLDVGVWYLGRALERWKGKDDPVPFALAEYNAGKSRVDRWIAESKRGPQATSNDLLSTMDIVSTRRYVEDITARYRFYQKRGKL